MKSISKDETIADDVPHIAEVASEHRDLLGQYLKDISAYPLINRREEDRLCKIMATSKSTKAVKEARDKLIVSNLRLVIKWAMYYDRAFHYSSSLTVMDLITVGNLSLNRAAKCYDMSRGAKFSTFATIMIKQGIYKVAREDGSIVRKPRWHDVTLRDIKSLREANDGISDREIRDKLKISDRKMERAQMGVFVSREEDLDLMLERGEIKLQEDPLYIPIPDQIARKELLNVITDKLHLLPPKARDIFVRKTLGGETLESIGQSYGITREAIRMKYMYAVRKLKSILRLHFDKAIADKISLTERDKIERRGKLRADSQRARKAKGYVVKDGVVKPNKWSDQEFVRAYHKAYREKQKRRDGHERGEQGGDKSGEGVGADQGTNRRNFRTRQSAPFVQKLLKETDGGERHPLSTFEQITKDVQGSF